jgi:hypothetical protein
MEDVATSAVGHERASAVLEVVEILLPKPHVLPDAGDAARVLEGAADAAQRPHRSRPSSHQLLGRSQRIRGPRGGGCSPQLEEGMNFWLASLLHAKASPFCLGCWR